MSVVFICEGCKREMRAYQVEWTINGERKVCNACARKAKQAWKK